MLMQQQVPLPPDGTFPGGVLTYAPPSGWESYQQINVTNTTNRIITIPAGQDRIVNLTEHINTPCTNNSEAYHLKISGGRNVVIIGGRISVPPFFSPTLQTTHTVDGTNTTITVEDPNQPGASDLLAQFHPGDATAFIRVRGHAVFYTGISGNTFTGCTWGGSTPEALPLPLSAGVGVAPGERQRMGLYLASQTGIVHVEGVSIDGLNNDDQSYGLGEGIQAFWSASTDVRIQACHIGPVLDIDYFYQAQTAGRGFWANHPDCIQPTRGPGVALRMNKCTISTTFQGVFIYGSSGGLACPLWQVSDCNSRPPVPGEYNIPANATAIPRGQSWDNNDIGTTVPEFTNVYHSPTSNNNNIASTDLQSTVIESEPPGGDFAPRWDAYDYTNYVSPGYL
jgi:hypothetical protein